MSETQIEQPEQEPQEGAEGTPKTFDAEYVEKLRKEAAKYRTEAKENADAAKRLVEIEDAQKSEAQKAADRMAEAEKRAAEAEAKVLRREVALEFKLDKDDAELLDALTDEDAMKRFAERLANASEDKRKKNNRVPNEGKTPQSAEDPMRSFASGLFDRARNS